MSDSPLELALRKAQAIQPNAEHEIDVLRQVLRGELGTDDQRSVLIRIIKQNTVPATERKAIAKLFINLGQQVHAGSYLSK